MISANQTLCPGAACCLSLQVLSPEPQHSGVPEARPSSAPTDTPLSSHSSESAEGVALVAPHRIHGLNRFTAVTRAEGTEKETGQEVIPCCFAQSSRAPDSTRLSENISES